MSELVIFDIDDVLWNLNESICKNFDIDMSKIKDFKISNNDELTDEEKKTLINAYHDVDSFRIPFNLGAERLFKLRDLGYNIIVESNCLTNEIVAYKRKRVKSMGIKDAEIKLNLIGIDDVSIKKTDADVFVDDNPYNIVSNNSPIILAPKIYWNQSNIGLEMVKNKNVTYFDDLNGIIDFLVSRRQ